MGVGPRLLLTASSVSSKIVPTSETGDGATPGVAGDLRLSITGFVGGLRASPSEDLFAPVRWEGLPGVRELTS